LADQFFDLCFRQRRNKIKIGLRQFFLLRIFDVANLTVAVLQQLNGGMFQVTVLSEPNSTAPEFLPEQTTR
jgi:hypothetical protein